LIYRYIAQALTGIGTASMTYEIEGLDIDSFSLPSNLKRRLHRDLRKNYFLIKQDDYI